VETHQVEPWCADCSKRTALIELPLNGGSMPGETAPRKIGRGYARNLDAGPFQPMIGSFDLHLRAEHKSPKTITIYTDAATYPGR
jgi:hypothetical protein